MIDPQSSHRRATARPSRARIAALAALLVVAACADDPPAGPDDDGTVTTVDSVPASRVEAVARRLHDRIASGQDPEPIVREILVPLLPVLDPATERARIERFLDAGDPVVPTTTVAAVSDALARGHLVTLESFFVTVSAKGARDAATGEPLTAARLGAHVATLGGRDLLAREELLPALVGALGRERARRRGLSFVDPAWGDAGLDALQLTLLEYALHWAGGASGPSALRATPAAAPALQLQGADRWLAGDAAAAAPGKARVGIFDRVAEWTDFPAQAPQHASICLPLVLFRTHLQPSALNRTLGTRVTDTSRVTGTISHGTTLGGAPEVELSLTAAFPGVGAAGWLAERAGCSLPASAALADKPVVAGVTGALLEYATPAIPASTTNSQGAWTTRLFAVEDPVPNWLRVDTRTDSGDVYLTTWNLVPGWEGVQLMVGTGPVAQAADRLRFHVNHFALPRQLEVGVRTQYRWGQREDTLDAHATGLMTGRLALDPFEPTYRAEGRDVVFNYATLGWERPASPTCTPSFGGIGGPVPMIVRLRDWGAGREGIAVSFASDAQGELPRERLDALCNADGIDTHWFTHFWRIARREAPISLVGSQWTRTEPGVLATNFGNAGMDDGLGNWWGEWIWIELRAIP